MGFLPGDQARRVIGGGLRVTRAAGHSAHIFVFDIDTRRLHALRVIDPTRERMMKNLYWSDARTPRAGSVAMMVGLTYREVPGSVNPAALEAHEFYQVRKRFVGVYRRMHSRSADLFSE